MGTLEVQCHRWEAGVNFVVTRGGRERGVAGAEVDEVEAGALEVNEGVRAAHCGFQGGEHGGVNGGGEVRERRPWKGKERNSHELGNGGRAYQ